MVGAVIVSGAFADPPLDAALIATDVLALTGSDVTVKVPLVAPAAIDAVAGTVAAAVLAEVRATVIPPTGAGLLMVAVPVELPPPTTVVGVSDTPVTVGPLTVKVAV
jgi:hypothetical protein